MGHLAYLEADYRDMQDVEFTVQDGELFVLQTRAEAAQTRDFLDHI